MTKYTPMIEQYLAVKAEVPDAFLFFRLGDFYELFFDDAVKAASELEITLTARDGGAADRIPMCGVPHHAAEGYINRLIERGFKVAICEQVEDPAQAKGVVRREIVRIVTPGTAMESKQMAEKMNNYLVVIAAIERTYGLVACDLSTGELHATSIAHTFEAILDEAAVYKPSEMLVSEQMEESVKTQSVHWSHQVLVNVWEGADDHLSDTSIARQQYDQLDPAAKLAINRLLHYLHETQKRSLTHLTNISSYVMDQYMVLDGFTRRNLELMETVKDRRKQGSLLWVLDHTTTAMGARLLRRWLDKPLYNKAGIESRLEAVDGLLNDYIRRDELRQALRDVYDIERLVGRICYGSANARDMQALHRSLTRIPTLIDACTHTSSTSLQQLVKDMDNCQDISEWIGQAIDDEPPITIREGGIIRLGYNEQLDELRNAGSSGKQWMADLERQEREVTGIKSLKIGFNKVFGYYIEISKSNLQHLPEGRYERKQTLANAERFVTPELKEKESFILDAQDRMVELEYDLFQELRERIAEQNRRLQKLAEIVAEIDVYQSFATVAADNRYCKPTITEGFDLHIKDGRHPVVEAVLNEETFVHNDTMIFKERNTMLITGPNMAGKSTYMRQVALITVMAQIGSFVPAQSAQIPIVDRIFTRIGAADDLIGGQSTFMVEMMDIRTMTEKATMKSLVIIDELGRGTSTGEGMAIAQAVIEFLHDHIGCKTLVSTHFHELAHLEESLSSLQNFCMAVKESGDQVAFLRKLVEGAASTSYGIYCARIAGLPETIIERSYTLLNHFEARSAGGEGHIEAQLSQAKRDQAVQLSLFETQEVAVAKEKESKSERKVLHMLDEAELLTMTPIAALNFLFEMKQLLQNEKRKD